ncbi:hypothetical protein Tco_0997377 [Tanacetum coccineum]
MRLGVTRGGSITLLLTTFIALMRFKENIRRFVYSAALDPPQMAIFELVVDMKFSTAVHKLTLSVLYKVFLMEQKSLETLITHKVDFLCLAEPDVQVPLDEIEIDENLRFVEEPIEMVEPDVKKLKRRRIPLVKVR